MNTSSPGLPSGGRRSAPCALRSIPAQNTRSPAPVSTTTTTVSSASAAANAEPRPPMVAPSSAFARSGLSIVITRTAPCVVSRMVMPPPRRFGEPDPTRRAGITVAPRRGWSTGRGTPYRSAVRIGVFFPTKEYAALDAMAERFRMVADRGLSSIWLPQSSGFDALTVLAYAGSQVPRVELGTSVIPTYPRHPVALAAQALTVNAAVDGRLLLGIGLSHKA